MIKLEKKISFKKIKGFVVQLQSRADIKTVEQIVAELPSIISNMLNLFEQYQQQLISSQEAQNQVQTPPEGGSEDPGAPNLEEYSKRQLEQYRLDI